MSLESAKAFLEKMRIDKEFHETVGKAKNKEERIKMVKEAGFEFTLEDIQSVKGEISDELLETISGGACWNDSSTECAATHIG